MSHNSSSYLFKMCSCLLSLSGCVGMGQNRKAKQVQLSCCPRDLIFTLWRTFVANFALSPSQTKPRICVCRGVGEGGSRRWAHNGTCSQSQAYCWLHSPPWVGRATPSVVFMLCLPKSTFLWFMIKLQIPQRRCLLFSPAYGHVNSKLVAYCWSKRQFSGCMGSKKEENHKLCKQGYS